MLFAAIVLRFYDIVKFERAVSWKRWKTHVYMTNRFHRQLEMTRFNGVSRALACTELVEAKTIIAE